jgi:hypothetical protein
MLKKQYVKSRKVWKVTFELPETELPETIKAKRVHLVGDFNDWDPTAMPMVRRQGTFRATIELQPGQETSFRYLVNGEHWYNDRRADAYVPNRFGEDNCIVTAPAPGHA